MNMNGKLKNIDGRIADQTHNMQQKKQNCNTNMAETDSKSGKSNSSPKIDDKCTLKLLFGGDVSFDLELRQTQFCGAWKLKDEKEKKRDNDKKKENYKTLKKQVEGILRIIKRICNNAKISKKVDETRFQELLLPIDKNRELMSQDANSDNTITFEINYPSHISKYNFPFQNIKTFLGKRDLVVVNLETPLTDHRRAHGLFISDPRYAKAMSDAGIRIVNLANNHIFDAGERGFFDTMRHLENVDIQHIGTGDNLKDARSGKIFRCKEHSIIFLSYTQFCNNKFSSIAAEYPGILPLDIRMITSDIKDARKKADLTIVSLHWGHENVTNIHPRQQEIARQLIDAGADAIIGHHSHIPQGIEIYKNKPILYSLGNFIFGQSDVRWKIDNYLAEFVIRNKRIEKLLIHPVSGIGVELFQPYIIKGERSTKFFSILNDINASFGTKIDVYKNTGCIAL